MSDPMGPYCKYCDKRCFLERRLPDDAKRHPGQTVILATRRAGMDHDLKTTGYTYLTAINPHRRPATTKDTP